ncbi:MAG: exosortase/archaeosortase family protein [Candidatus Heimdallarchaeota archaeon]|nr:exosortase/archaeosortase family protein [Candidatus Heimdallarchaeota archaeon]MDH5644456.1 exosortase/archaeosortase family protein [Candidatus Heimdallarchaeota archaeon]
MLHLIPTEEENHPLLKLQGKDRTKFAIRSFLITAIMTAVIYIVPDYYFLEWLTTWASFYTLKFFGFDPIYYTHIAKVNSLEAIDLFFYNLFDKNRNVYPAIKMSGNGHNANYMIVRACTGMQAGGLLLGLIWSTPAENKNRIKASIVMLIALFIGNFLRIALIIAMATLFMEVFDLSYSLSWHYAHDVLGRPIGFFGTIGFTALIEVRKVRILDTITVWIDTIMGTKPTKQDSETNITPEVTKTNLDSPSVESTGE